MTAGTNPATKALEVNYDRYPDPKLVGGGPAGIVCPAVWHRRILLARYFAARIGLLIWFLRVGGWRPCHRLWHLRDRRRRAAAQGNRRGMAAGTGRHGLGDLRCASYGVPERRSAHGGMAHRRLRGGLRCFAVDCGLSALSTAGASATHPGEDGRLAVGMVRAE